VVPVQSSSQCLPLLGIDLHPEGARLGHPVVVDGDGRRAGASFQHVEPTLRHLLRGGEPRPMASVDPATGPLEPDIPVGGHGFGAGQLGQPLEDPAAAQLAAPPAVRRRADDLPRRRASRCQPASDGADVVVAGGGAAASVRRWVASQR
jgi:hypothetical protein